MDFVQNVRLAPGRTGAKSVHVDIELTDTANIRFGAFDPMDVPIRAAPMTCRTLGKGSLA